MYASFFVHEPSDSLRHFNTQVLLLRWLLYSVYRLRPFRHVALFVLIPPEQEQGADQLDELDNHEHRERHKGKHDAGWDVERGPWLDLFKETGHVVRKI